MMRARMSPAALLAIGFAGGIAIGVAAWGAYQDRHASSLFSPKARRRAAALSRLSTTPLTADGGAVDTVMTLREYVAWERNPVLRDRGARLLARLTRDLDGTD